VLGRRGESLAAEGRNARARGLGQLEATAGEVLASPGVGRTVDQALAGPLPETVARSLVERRVVERVAEQVLASSDLQAAVEAALEHAATERLVRETLASPGFERIATNAADSLLASNLAEHVVESAEMQRLVEEIASSPAVRAAIARQTMSLGDEVAARLRRLLRRLDDGVERRVRGWLRRAPSQASASGTRVAYGGLGSRGTAFVIDLALIVFVFLMSAAFVWFVAALVDGPWSSWLHEALATVGGAYLVGAYLVFFWTLAGQTPGMRVMGLRVADRSGGPPRVGRSLVRLIGLLLAIIPMFAGFLPVLFDRRRRALQDYLAGTVVVYDGQAPAGADESVGKHVPPVSPPPGEESRELPALLE
jgi:uncharacterized RDD family membrane protein YckC